MIINWTGGSRDVTVKDSSFRLRQIMGSNNVTLNFSLPDFFEFPLGSTIDFQEEEYTLNTPQSIKEVNSTNFEYTLVFGGNQDILKNYKIKDSIGGLKFPFTAKPEDHLQLIVDVLNANGSGWSIGSCIDENEKLISYNHNDCYDALNTIATNFETEWEIVGKVISLHKVSYNKNSPIALSYGKGNGFKSGVGRKNDGGRSGFNKLYVQGGKRNIDLSVYGSVDLLLPKSQSYDYMGNTYNTDADGLSVVRDGVTITNKIEASLDASHIYPKRIGTITEVVVVDAGSNFYDFKDSAIPADLDYSTLRMNGERITIYFESGKLAGREFDIEQSDTAISGYIHAERRFKLVPKEEDGYIMPNATFIPEVGDKYSVYGMMMPLSYISDNPSKTGASWTMFKEAAKHFYENEESKFSFTGELDGIWAKKDWINIGGKLVAGGYVTFSDTEFEPTGVDIRITSVRDSINNPYSPTIQLSNSVQGTSIASDLDDIKSNKVVIDHNHKKSIDFVRRYFRDSKETIKLLEAGQLNFSTAINPISVETMALLVGDKSLQFRFVDGSGNQVSHAFNYDDGTKIFTTDAGILQHLTLEIDAVSPSPDYKEWNMASFVSAALTDGDKSYYLYAKVSKTANTGTFLLSETAIGIEDVAGHYHLLTAIINSEYQEDRSYATMYGFTEILSGQIKVDKLTSGNGLQVIELLSDQILINAKVTFSNDSPALTQVSDQQDPKIAVSQAAADAAQADADTAQTAADNAQSSADTAQTSANNAQTAANNAQSSADGAQTDANTANTLLSNIASDSKLTPTEKYSIQKEWDVINSEKTLIDSQADVFSVSKTNYNTKFVALNNYLNVDTHAGNSETLLNNLSNTSVIVGSTFRAKFKDYYDEKINILNAISAKAKTLADAAQADANTAQTAANNAQTAANNAQAAADAAQVSADAAQADADIANALLADIAADDKITPTEKLATKKEWDVIVSEKPINDKIARYFDVSNLNIDISTATDFDSFEEMAINLGYEMINWEAVFDYDQAYNSLEKYLDPILTDLTTTSTIVSQDFIDAFKAYYDAKIAFANSITRIARILADNAQNVADQVFDKTDFISETTIDGNRVATGILGVGNENGANAFVSGQDVGADAIRFAAGSSWANRSTAPFRVLDDGSLYASKGDLAGWLITQSQLKKDSLHLNAIRAALEIYDSSDKLAVDISGASTLGSLTASTITPSATVITGSTTNSTTSAETTSPSVFQGTSPLIYGTGVTFSGTAGDVVTLAFDLYQSSGTPYYESSYVKSQGGAILDYEEEGCYIGVEITDPNGGKIYLTQDASVSGSVNGLTSFSFLASLTLIAGTYTIKTLVQNSTYAIELDYVGVSSAGTTTVDVRTPKMQNLVISLDANKTEIIAGGFQVVKSSTQYLRADKNAADTGTGNAFLTSGGWWYHTGTFTQTSDKRQKFNIKPFFVNLDKFRELSTNEYDQILNPLDELPKVQAEDIEIIESVGLMAQELEEVMPKAVHDNNGIKSVDGSAVNAMLVNVLQQALKKIEVLEKEVKVLKDKSK